MPTADGLVTHNSIDYLQYVHSLPHTKEELTEIVSDPLQLCTSGPVTLCPVCSFSVSPCGRAPLMTTPTTSLHPSLGSRRHSQAIAIAVF